MVRPRLTALVAAVIVMGIAGGPAAPRALATATVRGTPLQLLARLATKSEHYWGYARSYFPTWSDADGDGCNTRYEVLIKESLTPVSIGPGCYLTGGTWRSVYDGSVTGNPTRIEVDHVVALKEAWDSGAWAWTASRRKAFANDLGDGRTLRGVSISANESKGDSDPAQWLPPLASFRCQYVIWWVDIKVRWRLAVDARERSAIKSVLAHCSAPVQTVTVA
jgi:hypothetical protein